MPSRVAKQLRRRRCSQERPRAVARRQGDQGCAHVSNDGAGGGDRTYSWGFSDFYGFLWIFLWEKRGSLPATKGLQWWKPWENVRTWGCVPLFNGCKNLDKNKDRMGNLGCTDFWMNRVECCGTQKKHHRPHLFGVCLSVKRCMGISDLCIYIYIMYNVMCYCIY